MAQNPGFQLKTDRSLHSAALYALAQSAERLRRNEKVVEPLTVIALGACVGSKAG